MPGRMAKSNISFAIHFALENHSMTATVMANNWHNEVEATAVSHACFFHSSFQGSRLDDQRCAAPPSVNSGPTVPDEDFFGLIVRSQSNRMEEQRVPPPPVATQSKPD